MFSQNPLIKYTRRRMNMNPRSLAAIIFAVILAIELLIFMSLSDVTTRQSTGKSGFFASYETVTNRAATESQNQKYMVLIGATAVIGAIVTFSLPNKKTKKQEETPQ
jgi:uncharacterized protein involved in response to NO